MGASSTAGTPQYRLGRLPDRMVGDAPNSIRPISSNRGKLLVNACQSLSAAEVRPSDRAVGNSNAAAKPPASRLPRANRPQAVSHSFGARGCRSSHTAIYSTRNTHSIKPI